MSYEFHLTQILKKDEKIQNLRIGRLALALRGITTGKVAFLALKLF